HTRFSRDWSSDVCSSDLKVGQMVLTRIPCFPHSIAIPLVKPSIACLVALYTARSIPLTCAIWEEILISEPGFPASISFLATALRSEERRVGKESRARCDP